MATIRFLSHFTATVLALMQLAAASTILVPTNPAAGDSVAQWTAGARGFDGPKVQPINSTAYDWWYFDIVSSSLDSSYGGLQSVTVIFYTATAGGFTPLAQVSAAGYTSVDLVQLVVGYANGSTIDGWLNSTEAILTTCGDDTIGNFLSDLGNVSFSGSQDLTSYVVTINAPALGITGTLDLKSIAPPHYAGGVAIEGQDMQIAAHIGWANAIPDSIASANLVIAGEDLNFTGYGYHDKNWGVTSFADAVDSWYWGHGRLGEFSVVWFDYRGPNGETSVSGYVAKDNKIVAAGPSGVQARPIGENSTYPPLTTTGAPTGFHVEFTIPEGLLSFDVIGKGIIAGASGVFYTRWVGWMTGGLNNATDLEGAALYEQFAFGS